MDPLVLKKLNQARRNRRAVVVVTHLNDGRDRIVNESDQVEGELGAALEKVFRSGKSVKLELPDGPMFLNVHLPPPRLVVIGAVHISQALMPMARLVGFAMEVIDPRTAFATPERFFDVELFAEWPEDVLKARPLDAYTALVAVTHDPKIDDFAISEALRARCFYVGALGSRKTHGKRLERLESDGISRQLLETIKAPIGLAIGASSPQEIAVAIMAEIILALRTRGLESV